MQLKIASLPDQGTGNPLSVYSASSTRKVSCQTEPPSFSPSFTCTTKYSI